VYDIAGILKCGVYLNGELLHVGSFKDYVMMYLKNGDEGELIADEGEG
jgi:hypothetical protein